MCISDGCRVVRRRGNRRILGRHGGGWLGCRLIYRRVGAVLLSDLFCLINW